MTLLAPLNAILQVIAAFLIFVACYLALVLSILIGVVTAELIRDRASRVRAHGARSVSIDTIVSSEVEGGTRGLPLLRHIFRQETPRVSQKSVDLSPQKEAYK
jgi:hypothetical protein